MSEECLIEPSIAPEVFVDGFGNYEVRQGVLSCAGYRIDRSGHAVIVLKIVMPVANLKMVMERAAIAAKDLPAFMNLDFRLPVH